MAIAARRDLSEAIIQKRFLSAAFVMTMVEVSDAITCIIDGMMTSRLLGATELAACGLAAPYETFAMLISGTLTVGCQTMCARSMGNGRMDEANRIFTLTCALGMILAALTSVLGVAFATPIAAFLGARGDSAALLPYTSQYLRGLFFGMPANVLIAILLPIVQLDGDGARTNLVALAIGVGDVLGNLFFAVVLGLGTFGFGLGTSFSYMLGAAAALLHFRKKDRMFRFLLRREDWRRAPGLFSAGLPRAVNKISRTFGPILLNMIVLTVGAEAGMTAMSVVESVRHLLIAPGWGFGSAAITMGGMFAGEQDLGGLRTMAKIALRWIAVVSLSLAALLFAAAPLVARLFLPYDGALKALTTAALRFYALALPFKLLNMALASYLQAVGIKRIAYFFNVAVELAFPVACAFALSKLFGIRGVFASIGLADALLILVYAALGMLRKDCGYEGADKLLFLPKGFGIPEEDSLSVTVTDMDGVVGLSRKVQAFCESHGVDRRRAFLSALCVEEMAGNTVQYGFADGKPHTVDIRILKRGDDVLLRLRDDCMRFDLKEKVACWTLDPEHPEENVGIRMILGMAKDVAYANAMQTNQLLITV